MHIYADMYLKAVYLLLMSSNLLLLYPTDLEMDRVSHSLHLVSMLFQGSIWKDFFFGGGVDCGHYRNLDFGVLPQKL